jgi:hypothetical protein
LRDILFDEAQKMRDTDLREIVGDTSESGGPTLFRPEESFTMLPGGENYRELVLKLPEGSLKGGESEYFDAPSGHRFPEDNILAHIRFTGRIDADGKKMLFLEEVQSDWNIAGRESGFKKKRPAKVQRELDKLMNEWGELEDRLTESRFNEKLTASKDEKLASPKEINQQIKDVKTRIEEIETEYENILSGVPDMPYKGSKWEDLVMKRMIRYAADNGYERLGWITGKDTAERYNLSKVVDKIVVPSINKDSRAVRLETGKGDSFKMMVDNDGKIRGILSASEFTGKRLDEVIGKELAKKVMDFESSGSLTGTDLEVGAQWAVNLYDKSLPSKAKKITKKKGAVGRTKIEGDTKKRQELADQLKEVEEDIAINVSLLNSNTYKKALSKRNEILSRLDIPKPTTGELAGASVMLEKYRKRKKEIERNIEELDKKGDPEANYVDITPEVKEIAEEGFSYFMPAGRAGAGSAPMQTGSPQPPSAGVFMPKVKLTEEEKEESKRILEKL